MRPIDVVGSIAIVSSVFFSFPTFAQNGSAAAVAVPLGIRTENLSMTSDSKGNVLASGTLASVYCSKNHKVIALKSKSVTANNIESKDYGVLTLRIISAMPPQLEVKADQKFAPAILALCR